MSHDSLAESAIFKAAVQLMPEQRGAYLDQACGENRPLRQEVESLLQAHDPQGSFLKGPAPALTIDRPITEGPGTIIGPYKLIQLIGEGGMGVVYMAQQSEPVRRLVALKIIKPGMDSRQVIARFEAERQALALMDHPNIAKVLDAGTTDSGRPYFVMELVKGIPITAYCDEKRLTPRQRLELFIPVCHAVQHAHQKGIIHRDLKPSNVMIALYDGRPVPKVIDFGVAKAAGGQLTEKTLVTSFGSLVGTLDYMSPEQAELNQLDVDTRSDIYALGVLLYELLTGDTPFDRKRLRSAAFDEMLRIIREEEPPLPSTRLGSSGSLPAVAASRQIDPAKLAGIIRGEIDWIVMKALEKDRNRRYETANGLARDIQRYLADESVEACPPSLGYRMSKISRRYRVPLTIAAGFAAVLVVGTAVSTWQAMRAMTAEREAVASQQKAIQAAEAERGAKEAETNERERAEANAKAARDNEQIAKQERDAADREKNNALAAREELRETLYASEMNLVQAAGESQQYARVAQLLDQQRPAAGQSDLRGFEWHYWHRKLNFGRLRSVEVPQLATRSMRLGGSRSFSQGAARLAAILDSPSDSTPPAGFGLLAIFDGVTGRELVTPFEPFPDQQRRLGGNRWLFITMSGDGTRLAAALVSRLYGPNALGGQVGHISIRDGGTGTEIRRIENLGVVYDIALTPDGSRIAVEYGEGGSPTSPQQTSGQTGVKIWDTATGELVQTLPMLPWTSLANRMVWSPDGARLLRQSVSDETIDDRVSIHELLQIVDVASGEELWEREFSNRATVHDAWSWSPDGKLLVIFEIAEPGLVAKHNVQLWDSYTGTTLAILDREAMSNGSFNNVVFSPDGQRLAVASRVNEIYIWEVPKLPAAGASALHIAAPDLTLQAAGEEIHGLAFGADGRKLQSVDAGGSLVTWDATAREDSGIGPDSMGESFAAAMSADATKIAFSVSGTSPMCSVWDLVKNREVFRLKSGASRVRSLFSRDGRRLALVHDAWTPPEESQIVIHDAQTGEALSAIRLDKLDPLSRTFIFGAGFRPDGTQIAAVTGPNLGRGPRILTAWDAVTGKQLFSVEIRSFSLSAGIWYSLDGASLVLGVDRPEGAIVYYDAATGDVQRSILLPSPSWPRFINVRHQMFGAAVRSDFVFGDLATGQERLRLPGYNDVAPMAISPDGSRLVLVRRSPSPSGGSEIELTFWSLKSGRQLLAFNRQGNLSAIAFSPDGNRLIAAFSPSGSGAAIKPIQIWDATPPPEEP